MSAYPDGHACVIDEYLQIHHKPMLGDGAGVEKGRLGKQVAELVAYDEKLNHKSLQLIEIDLDDGVKVNYWKFEGLVEKI